MRYQIQVNRRGIYRIYDYESRDFVTEFIAIPFSAGEVIKEFTSIKDAQAWIDATDEKEKDNIWKNV